MRVNQHILGKNYLLGVIFGEKLSLLGVHYQFKLTSVHYVKSNKKILAGVKPPLPLLGNARILRGFGTATPPYDYEHSLNSTVLVACR